MALLLFEAIRRDAPVSDIEALIAAHPGLVQEKHGNMYPLHYACCYRASLELILLLLQHHPESIRAKGIHGQTPLHAAVACDLGAPLAVVQALVECYPAGVAAKDNRGWTPLHYACRYGAHPDVIDYLVHHPDNIGCLQEQSTLGWTPLHVAVRWAPVNIVQALTEPYPAGLFSTDKDASAQTPLHHAIRYAAPVEIVEYLLQQVKLYESNTTKIHKTDEDYYNDDEDDEKESVFEKDGYTLLHCATRYGASLPVVQVLLQYHPCAAAVRTRDGKETPLHLACRYHEASSSSSNTATSSSALVVQAILEQYPAALYMADSLGQTPLHTACRYGASPAVVQVLLACEGKQRRRMSMFERRKSIALVREDDTDTLLRLRDVEGQTPLHLCCKYPHASTTLEVLTLLIHYDYRAIRVAEPTQMRTCLHYACHYFQDDVCGMDLVTALAEGDPETLRIPDQYGRIPLHYALRHCSRKEQEKNNAAAAAAASRMSRSSLLSASSATDTDSNNNNIPVAGLSAAHELVRFLVSKYAGGITVQDCKGRTALHVACQEEVSPETMHLLICTNPFNVADLALELIQMKSVTSRMA